MFVIRVRSQRAGYRPTQQSICKPNQSPNCGRFPDFFGMRGLLKNADLLITQWRVNCIKCCMCVCHMCIKVPTYLLTSKISKPADTATAVTILTNKRCICACRVHSGKRWSGVCDICSSRIG